MVASRMIEVNNDTAFSEFLLQQQAGSDCGADILMIWKISVFKKHVCHIVGVYAILSPYLINWIGEKDAGWYLTFRPGFAYR